MQIIQNYIDNPKVFNIYLHGSRVYGTSKQNSDYDYIVVVDDSIYEKENISGDNFDITIYTASKWYKMASENNVDFCECYFLPQEFKLK